MSIFSSSIFVRGPLAIYSLKRMNNATYNEFNIMRCSRDVICVNSCDIISNKTDEIFSKTPREFSENVVVTSNQGLQESLIDGLLQEL